MEAVHLIPHVHAEEKEKGIWERCPGANDIANYLPSFKDITPRT